MTRKKSYTRVIPRDLFNEASLLKCYGRMYLNLELMGIASDVLAHDGGAFRVEQDESSGGIYLANVHLVVRGTICNLLRPLNSREAWPLWLTSPDDDEIQVFENDGEFTAEFRRFLGVAQ